MRKSAKTMTQHGSMAVQGPHMIHLPHNKARVRKEEVVQDRDSMEAHNGRMHREMREPVIIHTPEIKMVKNPISPGQAATQLVEEILLEMEADKRVMTSSMSSSRGIIKDMKG